MKFVTKWRQKEFMDVVHANLVKRMGTVGKFVETEARRRLEGIQTPKKGTNYRRQILARRLTYVVKEEQMAVTAYVGIKMGTKPVAGAETMGLYVELGSHTAPPQPFLRPAVLENKREITELIGGK